ncbi:hypothetical protein FISHEDRAFT_72756 [Fistulina hepatica ATCC 64428]|nr:hypothetical protein FISHEDRAFT_72756 [Fistulina hepatica ATCC 64428]
MPGGRFSVPSDSKSVDDLISWFHVVGAATNITVDDQFAGDSSITLTYYPSSGQWSQGQNCPSCSNQPDPSDCYDRTWMDATYDITVDDVQPTVTISFTGTGIYVYGVLSAIQSMYANYEFTLDGSEAGTYFHAPGEYIYHVNFFAVANLENTQHTVVMIPVEVNYPSSILLDYVIYTVEDETTTSSSSSSAVYSSTNGNAQSAPVSTSVVVYTTTATDDGTSAITSVYTTTSSPSPTSISSSVSGSTSNTGTTGDSTAAASTSQSGTTSAMGSSSLSSTSSGSPSSSGAANSTTKSGSSSSVLATLAPSAHNNTSEASSQNRSSKDNVAAIVGGTVGGIVFVALVATILFLLLRRQRQAAMTYRNEMAEHALTPYQQQAFDRPLKSAMGTPSPYGVVIASGPGGTPSMSPAQVSSESPASELAPSEPPPEYNAAREA